MGTPLLDTDDRRMFWEQRTDAHNALVSAAVRRDRFETYIF
jgi:hypothetical protein